MSYPSVPGELIWKAADVPLRTLPKNWEDLWTKIKLLRDPKRSEDMYCVEKISEQDESEGSFPVDVPSSSITITKRLKSSIEEDSENNTAYFNILKSERRPLIPIVKVSSQESSPANLPLPENDSLLQKRVFPNRKFSEKKFKATINAPTENLEKVRATCSRLEENLDFDELLRLIELLDSFNGNNAPQEYGEIFIQKFADYSTRSGEGLSACFYFLHCFFLVSFEDIELFKKHFINISDAINRLYVEEISIKKPVLFTIIKRYWDLSSRLIENCKFDDEKLLNLIDRAISTCVATALSIRNSSVFTNSFISTVLLFNVRLSNHIPTPVFISSKNLLDFHCMIQMKFSV